MRVALEDLLDGRRGPAAQGLARLLHVEHAARGPDAEHAKDIARRLRSGNVAINQHTLDPAGPFGGFKQSGLGRENGVEGIDPYVELQTIPYVAQNQAAWGVSLVLVVMMLGLSIVSRVVIRLRSVSR